MGKFYSSRFVEANPRYQEALRRQREKEQQAVQDATRAAQEDTVREQRRLQTLQHNRLMRLLDDYASERPSVATIIEVVARRHNLDPQDLKGESRRSQVIEARMDAIEEIYKRIPTMGMVAIGRELGGRDRKTIASVLAARNVKLREFKSYNYHDDVLRLHRAGRPVVAISAELGCSRSTVTKILRRERLKQQNALDTTIR